MDLKTKIIRVATLPALVGASAAIASNVLMGVPFSEKAPLPLIGLELPGPIAQGITVGVASFGSEFVMDFVMPHLSSNEKLLRTEALVLKPVITGASLAGLAAYNLNTSDMSVLGRNFAVGAGSEAVGSYAYRMFKGITE